MIRRVVCDRADWMSALRRGFLGESADFGRSAVTVLDGCGSMVHKLAAMKNSCNSSAIARRAAISGGGVARS